MSTHKLIFKLPGLGELATIVNPLTTERVRGSSEVVGAVAYDALGDTQGYCPWLTTWARVWSDLVVVACAASGDTQF